MSTFRRRRTCNPDRRGGRLVWWICGILTVATFGCGTTRDYQATEQLVLSDAVDRSVSTIDFRPLSGQKVYLDTSYLRSVKGADFVNADYVTSSLRQQIVAAGCLMQDSANEADLIIEARIGTLGSDDHRMTYGVPENNVLSSAASLVSSAPAVPTLPEISVARREAREGAAKIAAFAYDRKTRKAVWQSGIRQSSATARDTWVLGVGPFQSGTIRDDTKLAGSKLIRFGRRHHKGAGPEMFDRPPVDYTAEVRFDDGWPALDPNHSGVEMIAGDASKAEPIEAAEKEAMVKMVSAKSPSEKTPAEKTANAKSGKSSGGATSNAPAKSAKKAGPGDQPKPPSGASEPTVRPRRGQVIQAGPTGG
ncbi:DUF6655 family protein [Crateriforma conspicua]|uniref:Uncharacterized protein n=1 Tax=Crateriforma conspicua TaxID=2527996 RepID=A0A5C6G143_9PLAN|nr:DUF6655 family protein [Crateriforma conspicua]TWU67605.1 hypothetical protein V7x_31800 [Crateriforma conspicua]